MRERLLSVFSLCVAAAGAGACGGATFGVAGDGGMDATVEGGVTTDSGTPPETSTPRDGSTRADAAPDAHGEGGVSPACKGGTSCNDNSECSAPSNPCERATCTMGCCGVTNRTQGAQCADDGGDLVCNGNGQCVQCNSLTDCPLKPCNEVPVCTMEQCVYVPSPSGTSCEDGVCDGSGHCLTVPDA